MVGKNVSLMYQTGIYEFTIEAVIMTGVLLFRDAGREDRRTVPSVGVSALIAASGEFSSCRSLLPRLTLPPGKTTWGWLPPVVTLPPGKFTFTDAGAGPGP
jgi:hypothetical protein